MQSACCRRPHGVHVREAVPGPFRAAAVLGVLIASAVALAPQHAPQRKASTAPLLPTAAINTPLPSFSATRKAVPAVEDSRGGGDGDAGNLFWSQGAASGGGVVESSSRQHIQLPALPDIMGPTFERFGSLAVGVFSDMNALDAQLKNLQQDETQQIVRKKVALEQRLNREDNATQALSLKNKLLKVAIVRLEGEITALRRQEKNLQEGNEQISQELQAMRSGLGAAQEDLSRAVIRPVGGEEDAATQSEGSDVAGGRPVDGESADGAGSAKEEQPPAAMAMDAGLSSGGDTGDAGSANGAPFDDGSATQGAAEVDATTEEDEPGEGREVWQQSADGEVDESGAGDSGANSQQGDNGEEYTQSPDGGLATADSGEGVVQQDADFQESLAASPGSAAEQQGGTDGAVPMSFLATSARTNSATPILEAPRGETRDELLFARAPGLQSEESWTPSIEVQERGGGLNRPSQIQQSLAVRLRGLTRKVDQVMQMEQEAEGKYEQVYKHIFSQTLRRYEQMKRDHVRLTARVRVLEREKRRVSAEVKRLQSAHGPLLRLLRQSLSKIEHMAGADTQVALSEK